MGVYDYFKGKCPTCGKGLDEYMPGKTCGEIQTKIFPHPYGREFRPGGIVPHNFGRNGKMLHIGQCSACSAPVHAVFAYDVLLGYASGYSKPEMERFMEEYQQSLEEQRKEAHLEYMAKLEADPDAKERYLRRQHAEQMKLGDELSPVIAPAVQKDEEKAATNDNVRLSKSQARRLRKKKLEQGIDATGL